MFDRKVLKDRAKIVLMRSYSTIFLACVIVYFASSWGLGISTKKISTLRFDTMPPEKIFIVLVIVAISSIIAIAMSIFVLSPLQVGLKKLMIENSYANAPLTLLLFPFGDNYKNIVLVQFMKELFVFLWSIPAVIPTILIWFTVGDITPLLLAVQAESIPAIMKALGLIFIWFAATLIFSVPYIIKSLQYTLVPYILAERPQTGWRSALEESKEMMVGNKWAYVKLIFSFALWYIAANLLCCIGGILVMPYVEATVTEMYIELSGKPDYVDNNFYGE